MADRIFHKDIFINILPGILILSGLYFISHYNFLLFHTLSELFSIVIASGIFMLVWNAKKIMDNDYFCFIGIAFLFVAGLDLLHTLAYKGMNIFPGYDANLPTQFWISSRYLESISFLIAPFASRQRYRPYCVLSLYSAVFIILTAASFGRVFPNCFIEGIGLTGFKIISEYIISLIFSIVLFMLFRQRNRFDPYVVNLVMFSIFMKIISELSFTFYISVYGFSNMVGHFFKIISFYLIYKAIIETGFAKPYNLLFRNLKQNQASLQKAIKTAKTANQAKSTFLTNMSHELRSPLNAIIGFAQVMDLNRSIPCREKENLAIILRSGQHLLNLINDVLDMSKINAGRIVFSEEKFDIYRLLDDMKNLFCLKAEEKGLELIVDYNASLPQYIQTDEGKLRQVLINLLNNAVKFTKKGSIRLQVRNSSNLSETSDILLIFEIEDTGPGIAPEELKNIFKPFIQTRTGIKSQEGTGLGLHISQEFVRIMGGELTVESTINRGSVFRFRIQAEKVENVLPEDKKTTERVIALEADQPQYQILVVDNIEHNRLLLNRLLVPLGFEVREAANGREAVEIWEEWEPHLICMDMRMPVMDGYEAIKIIKSTPKGRITPIIAVTASAFEERQGAIMSSGCDDFVRKPFQASEIFEVIHRHIGVRYVYEKDVKSLTRKSFEKNKPDEDLSKCSDALPDELLIELERASVQGDTDRAVSLTEDISFYDVVLADALAALISDFDYEEILKLIRKKLFVPGS
ncbi:MASE3 domain-containing protein [Desulfobacterales bacterium HSG16]|nr:MASE3 domain-containing protein [Desulfobacterales bacterium HSG16]